MSWLKRTHISGWSWRKGYGEVKFTVYTHYDREHLRALIGQYAMETYRAKVTALTLKMEDEYLRTPNTMIITAQLAFHG